MLDIVAVQLGYMAFNRFALGAQYAYVTLDSWKHNLSFKNYEFDNDILFLNQVGHPYQGSTAWNAARANGLSFWLSLPYPLLESYLWETFAEVEPPSVNDMITTPTGGILLGEMLHRLHFVVADGDGGPASVLARILAFALSPMDGFTEWTTPGRPRDVRKYPPWYGRLTLGLLGFGSTRTTTLGVETSAKPDRQSVEAGFRVTYGHPGDSRWTYELPFDYFDFEFQLAAGRGGVALNMLLSAWLGGWTIGSADSVGGLLGFFGGYDFLTPGPLQVSTTNFGLGSVVQARLAGKLYLQGALVLSAVPWGAAGRLPQGVELKRNYQYGLGQQAILELRLVSQGLGEVRLWARNYNINAAYTHEGWEHVFLAGAALDVRIWGRHAIGVDATVGARFSALVPDSANPNEEQRVAYVGLHYTLLSDEGFGAPRK